MMNAEQYAMKMNGRGRACLACRLRATINCLPGTSSPIIAVSWRSLTVLANADLIGGKSAGLDTNRPAVASVEPVARGRRLSNSCSHTSRSNYKYSTNVKMDAKAGGGRHARYTAIPIATRGHTLQWFHDILQSSDREEFKNTSGVRGPRYSKVRGIASWSRS